LSDVDRKRIRMLCRRYVDSVIADEWPIIAEGEESDKTIRVYQTLWDATLSANPASQREIVVLQELSEAMDHFEECRKLRLESATSGVDLQLWAIIAVGASSIVTLTFLFAPDSRSFHMALLSCLLVPMALNVYLLADYSYPFSGLIQIKPLMFEALQHQLFAENDDAPEFLKSAAAAARGKSP
jgi:hypothetical protein